MIIRKLILFTFLSFIISSCSKDGEDVKIKDNVSAFISKTDKTVAFGSAGLKSILSKSDFRSNDKLALLLGSEVDKINGVLDIDSPVYFVAEGPLSKDGAPEIMHLFIQVKNADSLKMELESRAFDLNKAGKIDYTEDGDFVLGIKDNLAIVTIRGGEYEAKDVVKKNFKKAEGDVSGGKIDEILGGEGDLVFGMHLNNLYETSNTAISKLDKKSQKDFKEMVADSYVQTIFKFEDGAAIIETKNFFSDKLQAQMFMKSDNGAPVLKKLGSGEPRFGLAFNVDMPKMNAFMNKYSPDATKALTKSMGNEMQFMMMAAGAGDITSILNGQIGALGFGEQDEFGTTTDFNFFLGLNKKGQKAGEAIQGLLSFFIEDLDLGSEGIVGATNAANAKSGADVELPEGCENFGKSGISMFINLDGIDFEEFDLEGEENLLRVVKYITFDYTNEGGRLYIKAQKGKENILKQMMDVVMEELASEMGNISIV